MNPALEKQLERLADNLAMRRLREAIPAEVNSLLAVGPATSASAASERAAEALDAGTGPITAEPVLESLESFSARQVNRLTGTVRPTALSIFRVVHLLTCHVVRARGYHRKAKQVSFFCPAEVVCAHLGLSRGSFYRSLRELVDAGVLRARGHKTTLEGRGVRCDGTLWVVKLFPAGGGTPRFHGEDFRQHYRDLAADIASQNTVWHQVRQSIDKKKKYVSFESVLTWALPPSLHKPPLHMTVASRELLPLEVMLDVATALRRDRRQVVDRAATAMAQRLGDVSSLDFYRYLVWQLLRLWSQQRDHFQAVYGMVVRAGTDLKEGFARRAGALFIARLKEAALWDEIRAVPMLRIA